MPTTFTSREFNQDTGRAKKAAALGPVFITSRGRPAHVLMSIEDYRRLAAGPRGIADLLDWPGAAEAELGLARARERARPAPFG
jgi:prevent-host-death family protein